MQHSQTLANQRKSTKVTQESSPECKSKNVLWETRCSETKTNEQTPQVEYKEYSRQSSGGNWLSRERELHSQENNTNTTDELLLALSEIETEETNTHPKHDKFPGWKASTQSS